MENNPEQIPTLIFEWLEKFEFVQLPPPQQQEALQYFSKDEYMELRETMREIRTTLGKEKTGKEKRKQYLLERFDTRYKKPQLKILVMPVALWKVPGIRPGICCLFTNERARRCYFSVNQHKGYDIYRKGNCIHP
jgi:hypothetical protein